MLRGTEAAAALAGESLPPNSSLPVPPVVAHKCSNTIRGAFNDIILKNKGFGGGILRIESLARGLLWEGSWGKVSTGLQYQVSSSEPQHFLGSYSVQLTLRIRIHCPHLLPYRLLSSHKVLKDGKTLKSRGNECFALFSTSRNRAPSVVLNSHI